jgi:hypothetical protein
MHIIRATQMYSYFSAKETFINVGHNGMPKNIGPKSICYSHRCTFFTYSTCVPHLRALITHIFNAH